MIQGINILSNSNVFGPITFEKSNKNKMRIAFALIDYPGYGNSSGAPCRDIIRSEAFDIIKNAMEQLIEFDNTVNHIRLNIIGYSLGAAVVIYIKFIQGLQLAVDIGEALIHDIQKYGY